MNIWVKTLPVLLALTLAFPSIIEARSGCCSHHGGVCGCGCCDGTGLSSTCAPYYPECGGGYGGYNSYQAPPTCPLMSTYNSVSEQCECMSGYVASGSSCISADQWCKNKYGYNSEHDYASDNCKCRYGYVWNSSGTACVSGSQSCSSSFGFNSEYDSLSGKCKCRYGYVWNSTSTKCISEDESCQNEFGYNSKATLSGDKCECKYGYVWNTAGTKCISQDESCKNEYGYNSKDTIIGDKCECRYGYSFNKAGTKCITKDSACQEINGVNSEADPLSDKCICTNGYEYDGTECSLVEPTPTDITIKLNKVVNKAPEKIESYATPTPIINLVNYDNKSSDISFLQKLLSWLFGKN